MRSKASALISGTAALASLLAAPPRALGQDVTEVYGLEFGGRLVRIALDTGAGTAVLQTGLIGMNALTRDARGVLYTVDSQRRLVRIDLARVGEEVALGPALTPSADIRGLAFSPDGTLYGVQDLGVSTNDRLVRIDPETGVVETVGSLNAPGVQSIDFSPDGTLYAWDIDRGLLTVNLATGAATDVNASPSDGTGSGIQGITFVSADVAYGASATLFFRIDARTGARTLVGGSGFNSVRGLAAPFVEAPDEPPTADAGPDIAAHTGAFVTLDGTGSTDDNTAPADLVYAWTVVSAPEGSAAELTGADTATPTLFVDRVGTYAVQLVVTDAAGQQSAPDEVLVSSENLPPLAHAGTPQATVTGTLVFLDGSASTDPDGDPIVSFAWTLAGPAGSAAALAGADTPHPSFTPDVPGDYVATLVVTDPFGASASATVVVTAGSPRTTEELIADAADVITATPACKFSAKGHKKSMVKSLQKVLKHLEKGKVDKAVKELESILERVDGCALRGSPDKKGKDMDWVTDCEAQAPIYEAVLAALESIEPAAAPAPHHCSHVKGGKHGPRKRGR